MPVRPVRRIFFSQSVLIAICPFLVASLLGLFWLVPQIDAQIKARQLQLAASVALQIDHYLQAPLQQAKGIPALTMVDHHGWTDVEHTLRGHVVASPVLQAIYVADLDGRIRAVGLHEKDLVQKKDLLNLDISQTPLFQKMLAEKRQVWSDAFLSLITGGWSVAFAIPSENMAVIGEVDLQKVSAFLWEIVGDLDQLIFIIDEHGQVIADQNGIYTSQQLNMSNVPLIREGLQTADNLYGEFDFEGRRMLGSLLHTPSFNWHVLVALPKEVAFETVWTSLRILLAGVGMALALAVVVAFFLSRRLSRSFESLIGHARRVASLEVVIDWPKSNIAEFNDLADDLQSMSAALRERERELSTLMGNLPGMAYRCRVDGQRTLEFVSDGCRDLLGSTSRELLMQGAGLNTFVYEEDLPQLNRSFEECLLQTRPCQVEYRITEAGGKLRWVLDHWRGVWDASGTLRAVEGLITDVTDRHLAEESLKHALTYVEKAKERLEMILQAVAEGLIFTDLQGRVVLMSSSAETLLGFDQRSAVGKVLDELVENPGLREHLAGLRNIPHDSAVSELAFAVHQDHREIRVQVISAMVKNRAGSSIGVITLLRDVSRERELDRVKSDLISTAAHELRTPLTVILGFAEVLLDDAHLSEAQREYLSIIEEKAEVLKRLIDDLLDLGRLESGRLVHVEKERCDICALIERVVGDFRLTCASHLFELDHSGDSVELFVDSLRLAQVLENLLGNAVKFSPQGSLVRTVCRVLPRMVRIEVHDQGIGMTPEQAEKMFDKFYRVDSSTTSKQGLGLGMTIVRSIIEAHDGQIRVESTPGAGTCVAFELPLPEKDAAVP